MCPIAQTDGHDGPGLCDQLVPGVTAVIDEVVIAGEDSVGEPVLTQELPDVLLCIELGTFGR